MRTVTRTIWGSSLQTALLLGLDYAPSTNTTLNEKFSVATTVTPNPGDKMPHVKYLAIGNNGHKVINGADGVPYISPVNHHAWDAALYRHIPFLMRERGIDPTDEVNIANSQKYAMKTYVTVNDVEYVAYYLKRMDLSAISNILQKTTVVEGVSETVEFIPDSSCLNPEHPALPPSGVISTDGTYLTASAILPILFDEQDVSELVNVSNILYGDSNRAVISEIGLCSGVDKMVPYEGSPATNYLEALLVQIVTHITGYYPVGFTNNGFEMLIDAGATEPLYGEGSTGG